LFLLIRSIRLSADKLGIAVGLVGQLNNRMKIVRKDSVIYLIDIAIVGLDKFWLAIIYSQLLPFKSYIDIYLLKIKSSLDIITLY